MWSMRGTSVMGSVFCNIRNHLSPPIARSTWIRRLATFFVSFTSPPVLCTFPRAGGGITKSAPRSSSSCLMGNPLSATYVSCGSTRSKKPEVFTMCLSEALLAGLGVPKSHPNLNQGMGYSALGAPFTKCSEHNTLFFLGSHLFFPSASWRPTLLTHSSRTARSDFGK